MNASDHLQPLVSNWLTAGQMWPAMAVYVAREA